MAASKREDLGQIVIRPPAGMRERIKAAAEANNRSMNAEIVATLEEKYPGPKLPGDAEGLAAYGATITEDIVLITEVLMRTKPTHQRKVVLQEEIAKLKSELKSVQEKIRELSPNIVLPVARPARVRAHELLSKLERDQLDVDDV